MVAGGPGRLETIVRLYGSRRYNVEVVDRSSGQIVSSLLKNLIWEVEVDWYGHPKREDKATLWPHWT